MTSVQNKRKYFRISGFLIETDHSTSTFSFQYWLDLDKQMNHQVGLLSASSSSTSSGGGGGGEPLLRFCVKFYTPDPAQIEEEYTRYLYSLQVKRDLAAGALQCNDNTAALMASYIVQGRTHRIIRVDVL